MVVGVVIGIILLAFVASWLFLAGGRYNRTPDEDERELEEQAKYLKEFAAKSNVKKRWL